MADEERAKAGDYVQTRPSAWVRVPTAAGLPDDARQLWSRARQKLGFIPNVFRNFALRPAHLVKWRVYYDELMRGPSRLSEAQREMIAVVVSATNRCYY